MLKINKKGWLHKFNSSCSFQMKIQAETTLCSYFWGTVWNLARVLVASAVVLLMLTMVGSAILAAYVGVPYAGSLYSLGYLSFLSPLLGAFVCAVVVGVLGGIGYSIFKLITFIRDKVSDLEVQTPEVVTLAAEFVRAKKNKFCPLIKVE